MAITKFLTSVANVQSLADQPTQTAEQLKVVFDKAGTDIASYINTTLTAEVDSVVGALPTNSTVLTRTNTDVYTPTTNYHPSTKKYVDDTAAGVVLGQIPDGTITEAKLEASVVSEIDGKALFKNGSSTFSSGGTTYTVTDAFITAATQVIISPTQEKIGSWSVVSAAGSFTITSDSTETSNVTFDWGATK
jgi:endo-1,4-beta-mannosidase